MNGQEARETTDREEEDDVPLPGFRFHPTDEELIGFYLRRKVEKKPLSIELIKQVDIYKFDPWDLPKPSTVNGDKEGYFFCKRGRKYRNSIRPNRVTGSGFWKATGIDKPVYSNGVGGEARDCIGLKKTLVYYRGCAGKGTKTDWMMHEFRLPPPPSTNNQPPNTVGTTSNANTKIPDHEAEVWTLCRIFKRNASHRKYTQDWRELSTSKRQSTTETSSSKKTTTFSGVNNYSNGETYVSFGAPTPIQIQNGHNGHNVNIEQLQDHDHVISTDRKLLNMEQLSFMGNNSTHHQPSITSSMASSSSNISSPYYGNSNGIQSQHDHDHFFTNSGDWDELRSVVEFAFDRNSHNYSANN